MNASALRGLEPRGRSSARWCFMRDLNPGDIYQRASPSRFGCSKNTESSCPLPVDEANHRELPGSVSLSVATSFARREEQRRNAFVGSVSSMFSRVPCKPQQTLCGRRAFVASFKSVSARWVSARALPGGSALPTPFRESSVDLPNGSTKIGRAGRN